MSNPTIYVRKKNTVWKGFCRKLLCTNEKYKYDCISLTNDSRKETFLNWIVFTLVNTYSAGECQQERLWTVHSSYFYITHGITCLYKYWLIKCVSYSTPKLFVSLIFKPNLYCYYTKVWKYDSWHGTVVYY